ncbi:LacI family DNA-binding transcriptional regulator [Carnimonas bestiolae]|uniref:LacI family DNA-binding transcriptional regulator n=1 Tax=Carnimonas bestiolae TaxID=3402172 RepID=UPI003EDBBCFF
MATIKQVAELAGVSQATVSRVMSGSSRVNEATRQRVEEAISVLDYQPNAFARSLASNRSSSVGLVISYLAGGMLGRLMTHIEQHLRQHNISLLIAVGHANAEQEREAVAFLRSRRCDALIVQVNGLANSELRALASQTPTVVVNREVSGIEQQCVFSNDVHGGYLATQHLLAQGHQRIVCISGPLSQQDAQRRVEGYQTAMRNAGQAANIRVVEGDFTEAGGRTAVEQLHQQGVAFTAIVAGSDDTALGAISALSERQRRIPEDVSIVGYDDERHSRHIAGGLTTIHAPAEEMGDAVAALARQLIEGTAKQAPACFMPYLVERATTRPPA